MELVDSGEEAEKHAAAALAAMARLEVAPTPDNFCLWYCHKSGRHPELSRVLLPLEQHAGPLGAERSAELYERFFGGGRQARLIDDTCQRLQDSVARLLTRLDELTEDTGKYGAHLARFEEELDRPRGLEAIRRLLSGILAQTRAMQERTSKLEVEFADTSRRMAGLRADLASAQRDAHTDALTGIGNRKHFDRALVLAAQEALEAGEPLALLLIDIDHFKRFNDAHGHQIGDQVLRVVAQSLTRSIKGRDVATRYGGEEFALILPRTDAGGARELAEQIRATIANGRIRLRQSRRCLGGVTVSIGAAAYVRGEPLTRLLRRADQALYMAKGMGRNQVVLAQPGETAVERAAS